MQRVIHGLIVATFLLFSAALLSAGGESESEASAAAGTTAGADIPDLEPGYYNIDEYQRLTGLEIAGFSESPLLSRQRSAAGGGAAARQSAGHHSPRTGGTLRRDPAGAELPPQRAHPHGLLQFVAADPPATLRSGRHVLVRRSALVARAAGGVRELGQECRRPHPYLHDSQGSEVVGRCPGDDRGHRVRLQRRLPQLRSARLAACLDALAGDGRGGHGEPGDRRPVHLQIRLRPPQSQLSRRYRHRTGSLGELHPAGALHEAVPQGPRLVGRTAAGDEGEGIRDPGGVAQVLPGDAHQGFARGHPAVERDRTAYPGSVHPDRDRTYGGLLLGTEPVFCHRRHRRQPASVHRPDAQRAGGGQERRRPEADRRRAGHGRPSSRPSPTTRCLPRTRKPGATSCCCRDTRPTRSCCTW